MRLNSARVTSTRLPTGRRGARRTRRGFDFLGMMEDEQIVGCRPGPCQAIEENCHRTVVSDCLVINARPRNGFRSRGRNVRSRSIVTFGLSAAIDR